MPMPVPEGGISIGIVCEGPADRPIACDLVDRIVIASTGLNAEQLNDLRSFRGAKPHDEFLAWSDVKNIAKELGIRAHGRFDNQGVHEWALEDAQTARKALLVMDRSSRRPDAVILLRDADRSDERRAGLEQARGEPGYVFKIVIGVASTKRECWALAGFIPESDRERQAHRELRRELGFDPCLRSNELTARHDDDKRSAKRVLGILTANDREREARCWLETDMAVLLERGTENGLAQFISEIEARLVPLYRDAE